MDVTDGSIVAMASFPNYDVSTFVDGISQSEWKALNDNPDHPLVNHATQGVYAPGSTFKLVTSIAMTQYGIHGPNDTVLDKGRRSRSGRTSGSSTTPATPRWAGSSCRAHSLARATSISTRPATRSGRPGTPATRPAGPRPADHRARVRVRCADRCRARRSRGHGARPRVEAGPRRQIWPTAQKKKKENKRRGTRLTTSTSTVGQGGMAVDAVAARERLRRVRERWHAVEAARRARREGHERQRRADLRAAGDPPDPDGRERAREDARRVSPVSPRIPKGTAYAAWQGFDLSAIPVSWFYWHRAGRREGRGQR